LVATDVDGETLTYTIVSAPTHGSLSGTGANLTYTPTGIYSGPDAFTFKATDAAGAVSSGTVSITVSAGPALPTQLTVAPATVTKPSGVLGGLQKYTFNNLSATLKTIPGDSVVAGVSISFTVGTTVICSATTNSSGVAKCSAQGPRDNSPTYTAKWAGNASFAATTGTGSLS
jgi:hypothetical protein